MDMKECPIGKILNLRSNRCNKIMIPKECPPGKERNEKGRCVKKPVDEMGLDSQARRQYQQILDYLRQPRLKDMNELQKQSRKEMSIEECLKRATKAALVQQLQRRQEEEKVVHVLEPRRKIRK